MIAPARPRLWQVSVAVSSAHEEAVAESLGERLREPTAVYRNEETGALTVSAYVERIDGSPLLMRRALAEFLRVDLRAISVQRLRRENWATSWKRHFKPIEIGGRLLIKPSWSRRRARPGQRVVILDPGLSFGSGQHETTDYCLRRLCRRRRRDGVAQSFLDIGTGSGILALAAAKLGYAPVTAFDVDPEAASAAKGNLRRNRISRGVVVRRADLTTLGRPRRRFDIICANLTYDLLAAEAERIAHLLAPHGVIIVAGILEAQFAIVTKSFQRFGLTLSESKLKNKWRSGQFAFSSKKVERRKEKL